MLHDGKRKNYRNEIQLNTLSLNCQGTKNKKKSMPQTIHNSIKAVNYSQHKNIFNAEKMKKNP